MRTETLVSLPDQLKFEKYLYIVVKKVEDKQSLKVFEEYILKLPKLEEWQIKDYVYSFIEGVDRKNLDWLIAAANKDIYRLENEIDKFRLFEPNEQKFLFNDMVSDGAFHDLSNFNVFNITNALTSKDYDMLKMALKEIESFDAEPFGVVTLLYQGFRKLIQVWLAKNPTTENTGLKSNVIWAINKQKRVYSKEQLIKAFLLLAGIDKELKTGNIDIKWLIDYLVCRILTY